MKIYRILISIFLFLILVVPVVAQSEQVNATIEELQKKIAQLQSQDNTLSKQITLLDSQVRLSTLKIADIKKKIDVLATEIVELNGEITKLEELKTHRLELALHRIPVSYKHIVAPKFGQLLLSSNFNEFLQNASYMQFVQKEDTELYKKLQLAQSTFAERKDIREVKKTEQEALQAQLVEQTRELERQKKQKEILLVETRNNEVTYQKLLAQALAERQALERALVESVKVGPIKKGDPIALVGNTGYPGCSTGAHLHFEVRKGGTWNDPAQFLSSKSILDEQKGGSATVGSGGWDWPLADTIRLTQHFGRTPYSWRYSYSGGIHTGYDMVSSSSVVIKAPADGTLYASSQTCASSVIKIKYIDHGDGVQSFYLHVQ